MTASSGCCSPTAASRPVPTRTRSASSRRWPTGWTPVGCPPSSARGCGSWPSPRRGSRSPRAARRARAERRRVAVVEDEWAARCPNPVLRESARRLGRRAAAPAAIAMPSPLIDGYRAASSTHPADGGARRRRGGLGRRRRGAGRDRAVRRRGDGRVGGAEAARARSRAASGVGRRAWQHGSPTPRRAVAADARPSPSCPRPPPSGSSSRPPSTPTAGSDSLSPDHPRRALRIGIGGPVGSGKSSLIAALCRELAGELRIGVVTNDIYTTEDAEFLRADGRARRPSGSSPCRPAAARTPRSATTSPSTSRRSRSSSAIRGRWTSCWSRAAATTSLRSSARRSPTSRSSSSTSPAATTSPARADRASRAPTCSSSTRPTSRRTSVPTSALMLSDAKARRDHLPVQALSLVSPEGAQPVAAWVRERQRHLPPANRRRRALVDDHHHSHAH